jgi:hypothetical protein
VPLQLEVDLAERRARAEEEGLDEEEDMEYDLRMVSQLSVSLSCQLRGVWGCAFERE